MTIPLSTIRANLSRIGALSTAERVARDYGVTLAAMLGGDRHRMPSAARHHLWSLIMGSTGLSSKEIGAVFGVDHSTVLQGVHKRERKLLGENWASVVVKAERDVGGGEQSVA